MGAGPTGSVWLLTLSILHVKEQKGITGWRVEQGFCSLPPAFPDPLVSLQPLPVTFCPRPAAGLQDPGPLGAEPVVYGKESHLTPHGLRCACPSSPKTQRGPKAQTCGLLHPSCLVSKLRLMLVQDEDYIWIQAMLLETKIEALGWAEIPGNELQTRDQGSQSLWAGSWVSVKGTWSLCPEAMKKLPSYQRVTRS